MCALPGALTRNPAVAGSAGMLLNDAKLWRFVLAYNIERSHHVVFLVLKDVAVEDIAELVAG